MHTVKLNEADKRKRKRNILSVSQTKCVLRHPDDYRTQQHQNSNMHCSSFMGAVFFFTSCFARIICMSVHAHTVSLICKNLHLDTTHTLCCVCTVSVSPPFTEMKLMEQAHRSKSPSHAQAVNTCSHVTKLHFTGKWEQSRTQFLCREKIQHRHATGAESAVEYYTSSVAEECF